ncbi:MAG: diguanylate cyclase [Burkholderiales bacterium]|nr:diguanylate cyclase [Burkholderiales bacterium]
MSFDAFSGELPTSVAWFTVIADCLIAASFLGIALAMLITFRHRTDPPFRGRLSSLQWILAVCGVLRILHIAALSAQTGWILETLAIVTGLLAVIGAAVAYRLVRDLNRLPSEAQLSVAHLQAMSEAERRTLSEQALDASQLRCRELSDQLELKVIARTAELADANQRLQREVEDRQRMQYELQIVNRKLEVALRQEATRSSEMEQLNKVSDLMQSCVSTQELIAVLANFAAGYLGARYGGVYLVPEGTDVATLETRWGALPEVEHIFPMSACWALRRGHLHPPDAMQHGLRCQHVTDDAEHICVPLLGNGEVLGLMHLRSPETSHDMALLDGIAKRAGLALISLKAREALLDETVHDPLTGLHNRRYLDEVMQDSDRRTSRHSRSIGVMMLDIDHFKKINDTYGHDMGDAVLRAFTDKLRSSLRTGDIACRYGGEEFTVLLSGASLGATMHRAEQFRTTIESAPLLCQGMPIPLTVSIGIGAFPETASPLSAVLQLADRALYRAKHEGRNRVVSDPTPENVDAAASSRLHP